MLCDYGTFRPPYTHSSVPHAQISSGARCLIFSNTLHLLPYLVCANSKGSGKTARMRRLAWAFAGRLCDKYHNRMSWLICSPTDYLVPKRTFNVEDACFFFVFLHYMAILCYLMQYSFECVGIYYLHCPLGTWFLLLFMLSLFNTEKSCHLQAKSSLFLRSCFDTLSLRW